MSVVTEACSAGDKWRRTPSANNTMLCANATQEPGRTRLCDVCMRHPRSCRYKFLPLLLKLEEKNNNHTLCLLLTLSLLLSLTRNPPSPFTSLSTSTSTSPPSYLVKMTSLSPLLVHESRSHLFSRKYLHFLSHSRRRFVHQRLPLSYSFIS